MSRVVVSRPGLILAVLAAVVGIARPCRAADGAVPDQPSSAPAAAGAVLQSLIWKAGIQEVVDAVSWPSIYGHIVSIASHAPRECGADVGYALADTLQSYGLSVQLQMVSGCPNVEAIQLGAVHPDTSVVVCAHYDALGPGADDNASGCALVLELARLLSQKLFRYTVRYILFTAEEYGCLGSRAWVDQAVATHMPIRACLNYDMVGWWREGLTRDFNGSSGTAYLLDSVMAAGALYTTITCTPSAEDAGGSDSEPFWQAGIPALLGCEAVEGAPDCNPYANGPNDLVQYINAGFCTDNVRVGAAALCVVADLLVAPMAVPPTSSREVLLRLAGPNPFNPRTTIRFDLPAAGSVRLAVHDVAGRLVRVLVEGERVAGSCEAVWDGRDETGRAMASGSYFARLSAGGRVGTVKMGLIR